MCFSSKYIIEVKPSPDGISSGLIKNVSNSSSTLSSCAIDCVIVDSIMVGLGVKSCSVCSKYPSRACSRCKTSAYCSKQCQKEDWKVHRDYCKT